MFFWFKTHLDWLAFTNVPPVSQGKDSPASSGDMGLISGLGRFPEEWNGNPLQHSCLDNSLDGGAWWAVVPGGCRVRED